MFPYNDYLPKLTGTYRLHLREDIKNAGICRQQCATVYQLPITIRFSQNRFLSYMGKSKI